MVHKRCHRGVHSGNTLRAFNSRFSRRYHTQSCIVSRVRPELLQKLIGRQKQPDKKKPDNIAVNVPLSLNKQSRWVLPSALIRQIQTNDIESELTVSVLERHKLKQKANCVSFHSNKGEVKRIQPRNGRYFGFNFSSKNGVSRRAVRRQLREELSSQGKMTTRGKTMQVYTEQGPASENMGLGESEVRYEVFYPSSSKSSISHNPKYIKQDVLGTPGDTDEHVQHGKPKKQHRGKQRKRMSLKDLDDCDLPSYCGSSDQSLTTVIDQEDNATPVEGVREEQNTTECLLTILIEKAQQLQKFKGVTKSRDRKKNGKSSGHHEDDKSHIVYLSDSESETPTSPSKTADQSTPLTFPVMPTPAESTRVMLPKDDVSMASLRECFGQKYFEAACKPRKFILDVTLDVQNVLGKQGLTSKAQEMFENAYLICIHDGFYDDEYDVYKVLLNSRLHKGLLAVQINAEESQGLYRGTLMNLISQTMDYVEGLVMDLKSKDHFPAFFENATAKAPRRQLDRHLGSAEAYMPSVPRLFQMGSNIANFAMPALSDMLEEDSMFCDVCYDDISPLTHDSAAFTSLLKCQHRVCDSCWSQHIHTRFHEGFVRLTCPGYDCQDEVKVGVLLSVVPLETVEKMLQRQEEVRIGGSVTEKWCPNESCGRVISLQSSPSAGEQMLQQDIVCACGTHICFKCLMPAHWPASCKQAEEYRSSLAIAVFPDRLAEVHIDSEAEQKARFEREQEEKKIMVVEGKHCPKCKTFVYKNGGCPQMTCRCGQLFCWYCAKPGFAHYSRQGQCAGVNKEKTLTTTLIVHHLETDSSSEMTKEKQSSSANRRQRVSLLEKAVEHRKEHQNKQQNLSNITTLARNVASAAAKDKVLTQHIIKVCTEVFPSSSSTAKPSETPVYEGASVVETVTAFLKNAARSKQELHEVVEYSLVLLKDVPDSLLRRRALRISEDLGAFCSFSQSVFDAWSNSRSNQGQYAEAVKAMMRLAEIQKWIQSALDTLINTVRKLRSARSSQL